MTLAKAFSRFSRIYHALHLRSIEALHAAPVPVDLDGLDESQVRARRLDAALEATPASASGTSAMTLAQAWALHEALQARLHQVRAEGRELDVIEQTALERLAEALGIPVVFEHTVRYAASFISSTLTWQGDFAVFKAGLELGLAPALDGWQQATPHLFELRFDALQFDRSPPDAHSELGTVIVSGEVSFAARVVDAAPQLDAVALARPLSVTVAHRVQPVPTQYLPLRALRVQEQLRT